MLMFSLTSAADIVSAEEAAANALDTFQKLRMSRADITGTTAYLLYRPETEAAIKNAQIEIVPEEHLVLISGRQKRREWAYRFTSQTALPQGTLDAINAAHESYQASGGDPYTRADYEHTFGLSPGTLKRDSYTRWIEEEGIVGMVRTTPITGTAYDVASFSKALPRLSSLAVDETQARAAIEATGPKTIGKAKLVEVMPEVFAWQCESLGSTHFIDAATGGYLSETEMSQKVHDIVSSASAMAAIGAAGTTPQHFTLAPVFAEQGMHQYEVIGGLCGPTSLSMLLDYWGEEISHFDVADVTMPYQGGGSLLSDVERAVLFSHASMGKWDHNNDGIAGPGYWQRSGEGEGEGETCYGYTVVRGHFFRLIRF